MSRLARTAFGTSSIVSRTGSSSSAYASRQLRGSRRNPQPLRLEIAMATKAPIVSAALSFGAGRLSLAKEEEVEEEEQGEEGDVALPSRTQCFLHVSPPLLPRLPTPLLVHTRSMYEEMEV